MSSLHERLSHKGIILAGLSGIIAADHDQLCAYAPSLVNYCVAKRYVNQQSAAFFAGLYQCNIVLPRWRG